MWCERRQLCVRVESATKVRCLPHHCENIHDVLERLVAVEGSGKRFAALGGAAVAFEAVLHPMLADRRIISETTDNALWLDLHERHETGVRPEHLSEGHHAGIADVVARESVRYEDVSVRLRSSGKTTSSANSRLLANLREHLDAVVHLQNLREGLRASGLDLVALQPAQHESTIMLARRTRTTPSAALPAGSTYMRFVMLLLSRSMSETRVAPASPSWLSSRLYRDAECAVSLQSLQSCLSLCATYFKSVTVRLFLSACKSARTSSAVSHLLIILYESRHHNPSVVMPHPSPRPNAL